MLSDRASMPGLCLFFASRLSRLIQCLNAVSGLYGCSYDALQIANLGVEKKWKNVIKFQVVKKYWEERNVFNEL